MSPTGLAVWADDGSEIACAINQYDYDGRFLMNHPVNERYDLALYSVDGSYNRSLFTNRQIDGFTSSVESIYFMKSRGYILLETLMYNSGGRRFDKVSLDGKITPLYHVDINVNEIVKMIPSPKGSFIARVICGGELYSRCRITFLDSSGLSEVATVNEFTGNSNWPMRWQSDSIFSLIENSTYPKTLKIVGPALEMQTSDATPCRFPVTSSSAWNPEKGYIAFKGNTESIVFTDTVPGYLDACSE
ncbi:MAG: hypothetical protein GX640_19960 [Fibrobacter sp.]|nr:hypothetical protein [Fibrobacter sp.]